MTLSAKALRPLEKSLGTSFRNRRWLIQALTHSSYKNELAAKQRLDTAKTLADNERLEFFGDAILSFVICKKLFKKFPGVHEGTLSKHRSLVVSRKHLFTVAKNLKLHHYLHLGKAEQNIKLRDKAKMMADTLEAVIAALYLDRGMKATEAFISASFDPYLDIKRLRHLDSTQNHKNKLQEYSQKEFQVLPQYKTVYDGTQFSATVRIKQKRYGSGTGRSKRDAEKAAAQATLKELREKKRKKTKKR